MVRFARPVCFYWCLFLPPRSASTALVTITGKWEDGQSDKTDKTR